MSNNKLSKYDGGNTSVAGYSPSNQIFAPFSSRSFFELDNWVDTLFNEFWREPSFINQRNWKPTDVKEDENNIYIEVELPRHKKENIKLESVNNGLKVTAKTNNSNYTRTFHDSRADFSKTDAKLEDGVLTIKVEKRPEIKAKEIEIK